MTQDRDGLRTADYWYELPERLIAQDPLGDRAASRLLVLDRRTGAVRHRSFRDIAAYLVPGDVLVLNDTRVIPARLLGLRVPKGSDGSHASAGGRFHEGGSEAEILLLKRLGADRWECIVRPGKKLKEGDEVVFGTANALEERPPLRGVVEEVLPDGNRIVRFVFSGIWEEVLDTLGEMPLPPYITHRLKDKERYQTVYARQEGSAAAPTAGLHFTAELLRELENKGVRLVYVTLHVGLGTFRPVKEEDITRHVMHSEWYQISPEAAARINDAKANGRRVICVGTTSCRTVESAAAPEENSEEMAERQDLAHSSTAYRVRPGSADTSIFIYPGYRFRIMDGLLTNFHLPASTLLMLVSAFAGRENILAAYRAAVEEEYRFFSFGDAMLIM